MTNVETKYLEKRNSVLEMLGLITLEVEDYDHNVRHVVTVNRNEPQIIEIADKILAQLKINKPDTLESSLDEVNKCERIYDVVERGMYKLHQALTFFNISPKKYKKYLESIGEDPNINLEILPLHE